MKSGEAVDTCEQEQLLVADGGPLAACGIKEALPFSNTHLTMHPGGFLTQFSLKEEKQ